MRISDWSSDVCSSDLKAGAIDWTSTINLDPAGLKGVRLNTRLLLQKSSLRDPFTGEKRQWSGFTDTVVELGLRHDIPASDWAWGGDLEYSHYQPNYRSEEHTSELQSLMRISYAVFCLKKKTKLKNPTQSHSKI